jgi:hypothetical protein
VIVPALALVAQLAPVPEPLAGRLELGIVPGGRSRVVILPGSSVNGSTVAFTDLNGLTAYQLRTGFDARGRKARATPAMRGVEDSDSRRA